MFAEPAKASDHWRQINGNVFSMMNPRHISMSTTWTCVDLSAEPKPHSSCVNVNHISTHSSVGVISWIANWRHKFSRLYHSDGTSCSPSGLVCLSVNLWPDNVNCKCPKTCSELVYTQDTVKKTNWAADSGETVKKRNCEWENNYF